MRYRIIGILFLAALIAGVPLITAQAQTSSPSGPPSPPPGLAKRVCEQPGAPNATARCHSWVRTDQNGAPAATSTYTGAGFQPAKIRKAYDVDQLGLTGASETIAIVDAYGSPTIQSDLAAFNTQFNLPTANLTVVSPGGSPGSDPTGGWALETALDVEWAHAIAPSAPILLVVANSNSLTDLLAAVDYATTSGAVAVSMSWGSAETDPLSYDTHFNHASVGYLASSGDSGHGVSWPAVSPFVMAVGGTSLSTTSDGTYSGESAWSGSGGGISQFESEPGYQSSYPIPSTGNMRGLPDVAYNADPSTGFAVYSSTTYYPYYPLRFGSTKGWFVVGGTSAGAPQWAGLYALMAQAGVTGLGVSQTGTTAPLYTAGHSSNASYHDITSGTNGSCGSVCTAGSGFDFVTGLGSPQSDGLLAALGGNPGPTPTPLPTPSPAPPTATPAATNTPAPTSTPKPHGRH